MASKWADKLYSKLVRCRTHSEAKALLDAALEEYHEALIGEIREKLVEYWGKSARNSLDKFTVKRVLDKLGRG